MGTNERVVINFRWNNPGGYLNLEKARIDQWHTRSDIDPKEGGAGMRTRLVER
jgi:hypothetical protein